MASRSLRIRLLTYAASGALLALFAGGGFVALRVINDGRTQREAMDASHRAVTLMLELRNSVFEMVGARNVTLSTPGIEAESLFRPVVTRLRAQLERLRSMTQETEEERQATEALDRGVQGLVTRLEASLRLERSAGLDYAMLLREANGDRSRLTAQIDAMIQAEREELAAFNQHYLTRVEQIRTVMLLLVLVAAILAVAAVWGLHRYLTSSTRSYDALAEANRASGEANRQLTDERSRLQSILDHASDPILLVDGDECIQLANAAAAQQFRMPQEALPGLRIRSLVPGYGVRQGEVQARRADGTVFPAELSVGPTAEGASVCILRDVTERHRLDALKSEFVSTVSHELRTPLTSIRASLGLVMGGVAGTLPEPVRELLDIAAKNAERLVLLVNDILDIEKIESGRLDFQRERVSARALLQQAVAANAAYGAQFEVRFELDEGTEDALVYADVQRIQQVLANLLSNAAKFSPRGGVVEVSLGVDAGNAIFRVRDHGRGIPPEFRNRIFQRFAQADSSDARQKGGTGLGLSISKAIIEHHAGSIGFEDAEGGGTVFCFSLPRLVERLSQPLPASPAGRRRALIVEDDADIARLLRHMLDGYGWDSEVARDAREAFAWLDRARFDAMTLDLMLPEEDGLSLFRRLRRREDGRALPVVVISATADHGRRVLNGDAVGVVDWLDKPIDPARLRQALRAALRPGGGPACVLHVEDDPDIRRVVSAVMGDEARMVPARSLAEARAALAEDGPFALVVIDVGLPDGSGLDLLHELRALQPPPPVLIFSASDMDARTTRSVAAALVKSRTDNQALQGTILQLIEGAPAPDGRSSHPTTEPRA
ncbi:response regulator [Pseudoroseomonas cervicalis]|uniref:response regulator n=1 Tax=Teichococcus cervicalis TaxID=204525 RepID=UPI00278B077F|nr:response regulator [Pseudoroseomonas cervicalis]MDQ1080577.1 signal transduction histidine kinase/DNA-binding response OmpR family regulator [Pseudoroseomonas cervicalis]